MAPKFLTKEALKYLQTNWEDEGKLPESLEVLKKDTYLQMQEKLFRVKYMIQFWDIGPETKVNSSWIEKKAMLAFSNNYQAIRFWGLDRYTESSNLIEQRRQQGVQ